MYRGGRNGGIAKLALLLAVLVGVLLGLGGYTFRYAEGLSYFSKDPKACVNCHIMRPQYDSWQKASHHTVATCVDCHLPHDFVGKYIAKADNGYRHSKAFTLQDFHEPILINERNSEILQANCIACHEGLVPEMGAGTAALEAIRCVHCHRDVGHGEHVGLGGPDLGEARERNMP
jgi:cytochrome c nitrite reductase small subunit